MKNFPGRFALALFICIPFIYCPGQSGTRLFDDSYVHEIRIQFDSLNFWEVLLENYDKIENDPEADRIYLPASISIDGDTLDIVGVRIKGFYSAWGASGKKKPLKVDLNEFSPDQEYDGLKKINLQNSFEDPSSMRDMLAYNIFNEAGIHAPRSSYAKVYLNNEYWGLYVLVEQVDKTFLGERFGDDNGNLYKNMQAHHLEYRSNAEYYKEFFDLKTNEPEDDWSRFIQFTEIINKIGINDIQYERQIDQLFEVEDFLKILTIDVILLNWDSYYDHGRNYYLYDNPVNQKFSWIPWDYNLSFSTSTTHVLFGNGNSEEKPLIENLLDRPVFLKKYVDAFKDILINNFTTERLFPVIDNTEKLISDGLAQDSNKFFNYGVFKHSLSKDTLVNIVQYFDIKFHRDSVFILSDCTTGEVPDSIWQSGIEVFDTCGLMFDTLRYDTVFAEYDTNIYVVLTLMFEYEQLYVGLKSFINQRTNEVSSQIQRIVIPKEPDLIFPLLDNSELVIYPNPASDFIILSGVDDLLAFTVRILDLSGKELLRRSDKLIIQLEDLNKGVYFLEFSSQGYRIVKKFIKI